MKRVFSYQSTVNSYQSTVNSYQLTVISVLASALLGGCGLRYAATEAQKQNAWMHARVCAAASQTAQDESSSARLCGLTSLSAKQSESFVLDYGVPEGQRSEDREQNTDDKFSVGIAHPMDTAIEQWALIAEQAKADSANKPDVWGLADGAMELGIALAGLLGGIYGVRAAAFLRHARQKAQALKEIVRGNELFKQLYPEHADRFKEAQAKQSPATKQLVSELK